MPFLALERRKWFELLGWRRQFAGDFDRLFEQGIIFDPGNHDAALWQKAVEMCRDDKTFRELGELLEAREKDRDWSKSTSADWLTKYGITAGEEAIALIDTYFDIEFYTERLSRPVSVFLRQSLHADAYPVFTSDPDDCPGPEANKADIVYIVLNKIPTPSESVSWEQIIEFRSDPDTAGKFLGLGNWMTELARARLAPPEVDEKLEWRCTNIRSISSYTK